MIGESLDSRGNALNPHIFHINLGILSQISKHRKQAGLIWLLIFIGHLYLSGVWLGVDL